MAIEKVGGTYVITGSQVKPGVTSTGQSWANLVTQQKYQLWKIANAEAARRIKFEQLNAQRQQQVVDQMRQSLLNQQNDTRAQIENLKQLQIEDLAKQQATLAQEQNLRGRPQRRTTSAGVGGGSGMNISLIDTESKLRRQAEFAEKQVKEAQTAATNAGADATILQRWKAGQGGRSDGIEAEIIDSLDEGGKAQFEAFKDSIDRAENARDNYNEFIGADLEGRFDYVERRQRGKNQGFGAGGSRTYYTKEDPIVAAPLADREPAIQRLEERLRDLERQQLNLTDVDIPVGDEIRTTRQILGSKFGYGSQRLPEQPAPAPVQRQEPQVQQDISRVKPVDREILDLVAEEEPLTQTARQPIRQTARQPSRGTDFEFQPSTVENVTGEEEPGISITDLAEMAYGNEPMPKQVDRFGESIDEERLRDLDAYRKGEDINFASSKQQLDSYLKGQDINFASSKEQLDSYLRGEDFDFIPSREEVDAYLSGKDFNFVSSTPEVQEFPTFRPSKPEVVDPFQFQPSTPEVQEFPTFRPSTAEVVDPFKFQPSTPEVQQFPTFRPSTAEVVDPFQFQPSTPEVQQFPTFRPSTPEVVDPFQFQPSTPEVVEFPFKASTPEIVSRTGERPTPTLEVIDKPYLPEGFEPFKFQPSTPTLQSQQDVNRSVLQQMRQAEIETLQNIVQEAMPKPSPFRDVKQVMDQASKTLNNADLQIAGLQMLKDYAYLQQTDPEEYFKIKDVVQSTVAKRLNLKEYQIQQAAKQLTKVNEVTPQKLANTVKGATASDAELVIQLTGALFDDVNSIESAYENARQQINTYADKGGLLEDQRIKMLTLLENYKAYKTLVVER
jgi:hypothetical protein